MKSVCLKLLTLCLASFTPTWAQVDWSQPEGISWRTENILSEGTRLTAEVFLLEENSQKKLPCILMAHGWGGIARGLRPDAVAFAREGFLAVAFDYRGWGTATQGSSLLRLCRLVKSWNSKPRFLQFVKS